MACTEFYVDNAHASASNMNGGSSSGAPLLSFTNGNWNSSTRVFTATGATLTSDMIGHYANVYADGSTTPAYLARVAAIDNTTKTVTLDATAKYGSAPSTSTTARTIKIGGVWAGMSGTTTFPFSMTNSFAACTNANGDVVRINIKGGTTYATTTQISNAFNYGVVVEGYESTVGDLGLAKIEYTGSSASGTVLHLQNSTNSCVYIIKSLWISMVATGSPTSTMGIRDQAASGSVLIENCRIENIPNYGIYASSGTNGSTCTIRGCEFIGNGSAGGSANCDIQCRAGGMTVVDRCAFHHPHASSPASVYAVGTARITESVFADCDSTKCVVAGGALVAISKCVFSNCSTALDVTSASNKPGICVDSCVFDSITNIYNNSASVLTAQKAYIATNNGYWNCTTKNNTGSATYLIESGDVDFVHSPLVDAENGDFTIRSSQGRGTQRGHLLLKSSDYSKGTSRWVDLGLSANNPYFTGTQ